MSRKGSAARRAGWSAHAARNLVIAGALETLTPGLLYKMGRRRHVVTAGRVEPGEKLVRSAAIPERNDLLRFLVRAETICQFKRSDPRSALLLCCSPAER